MLGQLAEKVKAGLGKPHLRLIDHAYSSLLSNSEKVTTHRKYKNCSSENKTHADYSRD